MTKSTMRIVVGSNNPVKVAAVKKAFQQVFEDDVMSVSGYPANSGVSDQPMTQDEAVQGAINRAKAALNSQKNAAYGVGVEGGIYETGRGWFDAQWVAICSQDGLLSTGSGIHIPVPSIFITSIKTGKELGDVIDEYWKQTNMKQAGGYVGRVTKGIISREQMIIPGVVSALIPFINGELFTQGQETSIHTNKR